MVMCILIQDNLNKTLLKFLMSENNKTNRPWMSQDLKRQTFAEIS